MTETMQSVETEATPTLAPAKLGMPKLPPRGDRTAGQWAAVGLAVYVGMAVVFLGTLLGQSSLAELFGLGEQRNLSLLVLVLAGVAVTGMAMWSVGQDILEIRKEEADVEFLERNGARAVALVLAPAETREQLLARNQLSMPVGAAVNVETLLDDRVRRAYAARMNGRLGTVSVEEMRVIAERRTARLGGFARYASTLLLLLAVLGTFAGVKTALPGLIDAVNAENGASQVAPQARIVGREPAAGPSAGAGGTTGQSLTAPLRAVADAFGGNALALIGAIAVGLMAQGLVVGRRNLLERLELVSAEYVYGAQDGGSADPLTAAVRALQGTAEEVHATTGHLLGIEAGLETLGDDFGRALDKLDSRLLQVLEQQEAGLHERTSKSLEQLELRVAALAASVDGNARAYGGLIDRIGERAEESRQALAEMKRASDALTMALGAVTELGTASAAAREQIQESSRQLAENTGHVVRGTAALTQAVAEASPTIKALDGAIAQAVSRIEKVDERAAASWSAVAEEVRRSLATGAPPPAVVESRALPQPDLQPLLREIARNTSAPVSAPISRAALILLPIGGLVLGLGFLLLLVKLGLLQRLF